MGWVLTLGVGGCLNPTFRHDVLLAADADVAGASSAAELVARVGDERDRVEAVVLGPLVDEPIRVTQRVHAVDADVPVLMIVAPERRPAIARSIQFAPFLGGEVLCHSCDDEQALGTVLRQAIERRRQRRRYQAAITAARGRPLPVARPRRVVRFLDRLLDVAPVGVVIVGPLERVLG